MLALDPSVSSISAREGCVAGLSSSFTRATLELQGAVCPIKAVTATLVSSCLPNNTDATECGRRGTIHRAQRPLSKPERDSSSLYKQCGSAELTQHPVCLP